MTTLTDKETRIVYKLIGDTLFCAPLFSDGTVDENLWEKVNTNLTSYHYDIINKLSIINQISANTSKGIWDDNPG